MPRPTTKPTGPDDRRSGSPGATTTIDGKQLPPPDPKFGGVIKENAAQSKAWWAPRVVPPKGAPNVLLIMTDDVGFGAPSTFGGVIPTPALDRIAKAGLRYTCIHSTALCSPTRAALITGRNHHSAGFGVVSEQSTGFPGYNSIIPKDKATIGTDPEGQRLRHVVVRQGPQHADLHRQPGRAVRPVADRHGLRVLLRLRRRRHQPVAAEPVPQHDGHLSLRRQARLEPDHRDGRRRHRLDESAQPDRSEQAVLLLLRPRRHARAAPSDARNGWTRFTTCTCSTRAGTSCARPIFANQKKLGVIPQDAKMTPWPDDLLKNWDKLTADEKKLFIRQVEVYAAYLAYTDHEIGRVIQAVEDMGKLDNTLIIYISGDNGSSAEGTLIGTPNEVAMFNGVEVPVEDQLKFFYDVWGTDQTYNHMAVGWTWAFDTPFSWTKQIASHFGGTRQGMCVSWPGHIKDVGGIRNQFHHVIDVVPTILEVTGIPAPEYVDGIKQAPIEGVSFAYTFDKANAKAPSRHKTQYFEMMGDHAIYHDGWIASTKVIRPPWVVAGPVNQDPFNNVTWELYDLTKDWTQFDDVAAKYPEKVKELKRALPQGGREVPGAAARRVGGDPPRGAAAEHHRRPHASSSTRRPMTGIPQGDSPLLLNTSYTITADIEVPAGGAEGMLLTSGGRFGGYGFYLLKGKPVFLWNLVDLKRVRWEGPDALDARQAHRRVRLQVRRPRGRHAGLQQHERHRPQRHRRAQGRRQGSRHAEDGAHAAAHPAVGRDLRHRLRHRHAGGRQGLPGAVQVHRQAQQADAQARPAEAEPGRREEAHGSRAQ